MLPEGWEQRRQLYKKHGHLTIYVAAPIDVMCMKALAARDEDFDVLEQMALSLDDAATIRTFLTDTRKRNIRTSDAQRGLDWLKAREISDE